MQFKIDKNPYDDRDLFKKTKLEITEGNIYCLVGCNGTGKSTVMRYMTDALRDKMHAYELKGKYLDLRGVLGKETYDDKLCFFSFDKHTKQANSELDMFMIYAGVAHSSTGEGIIQRLGNGLTLLGKFIHDKNNKGKSLWIFFDDCDAGTSIDVIIEIKDVVDLIYNDCKKNDITCTFILSANSYEMCKDYHCINAMDFKEMTFTDYDDYKKFVLHSRKRKDKTYNESYGE